jgi:hypothetical protein
LKTCKKECHPFRDGNLAHIETTKKLLYYLIKKGVRSITLKELVNKLLDGRDFPTISSIKSPLESEKAKISIPRTKQDFIGVIPENLMMTYRIIKRSHTIF